MWAVLAFVALLETPDFNAEGSAALDAHQYEAAAQAFTKAIQADPRDYTAHFNLGVACSYLHRDAEGAAEYRKALELQPGLYEAQLNLGMLLLRQKEPADALEPLSAAADQKPREYAPRYYLAEAQLATGALDQAQANYRLALAANPKSAAAELGLARALARDVKLADAAPHFRQAAQLDASFRGALLELADLYEKDHSTADAIAIYRELPDNAAAQARLGELLLEGRQSADAIAPLEAAYRKSPIAANRVALAAAYVGAGQFEKALPLLQEAVAAEPSNFDLRMLRGRALRDTRQFPAAAAEFSAALKLKPDEAQTWSELGSVLYMMGDYQQSLAALERARELGQDTAGNWFFRAIMLDKLKQVKPALEAYQKFLALSNGQNPNQEFQARQRSRWLKKELDKGVR
jgi:tetratricopeptide (TPR) repeat protein